MRVTARDTEHPPNRRHRGCHHRRGLLRRDLILDEPTAALDAKAEHGLYARIGELVADPSVLLISHWFPTALPDDRIYELNGAHTA